MANSRKGLVLDFDRMGQLGYLDPLIPFSRSSSGAYLDFSDAPQLAASDVPRFSNAGSFKRGWLVETQRTNLHPNGICAGGSASTPPTNWAAEGSQPPTVVRYGGYGEGYYVDMTFSPNSGGWSRFRTSYGISILPNTKYTFSAYYTKVSGNSTGNVVVTALWWNNGTYVSENAAYLGNFSTFQNGQKQAVFTSPAGANQLQICVGLLDNTTGQTATYSVRNLQIEEANYATSFIPTSGAAATRAYDYPQAINDLQLRSGMNSSQGTIILDFTPNFGMFSNGASHNSFLKIGRNNAGWGAGGIWIWHHVGAPNTIYISRGNTAFSDLGDHTIPLADPNGRVRLVYSWNGTIQRVSVNGEAVRNADLGTPLYPYLNQLIIGNDGGGGWGANALYHEVRVLPNNFPDLIIQQLSDRSMNPL